MTIKKFKSTRELKEAMQNVDKAIENEVGVDPVVTVDPILITAYEDNKKAEEHVEEVLSELDKAAEDVVEESPETPMDVETDYTVQLKLDESIEDFKLHEDGRQNRVAARDENDTDLYLDYDMLEFVYELLSAGSKGITNIAPITPIVHRRKTPTGPVLELPMKKFSPNGSQVIDKEAVYLLDLAPTQTREISRKMAKIPGDILTIIKRYAMQVDGNHSMVENVFEDLCDRLGSSVDLYGRDAIGYAFLNNNKVISTPQLSEAGNKVVIYSDDLSDFEQAKEGLMYYGITSEDPIAKRNKTSHWNYSMVVNVPSYDDGEPMSLEDWLEETGREIEDVMDEKVAQRFRNKFAKADKAANELTQKMAFERWVTYAFNHGDEDLDDIYQKMCDELAEKGIECDSKFYKKFMAEFEDDYEDEEDVEENSALTLAEN